VNSVKGIEKEFEFKEGEENEKQETKEIIIGFSFLIIDCSLNR